MSPKGKEKPAAIKPPVGRRFQPGQSGNPGGRPKVDMDFRDRCRGFMEREGWALLEADARTNTNRGAQARELIAAYAYGKPKQGVEVSSPDGGPVAVTYISVPGAVDGG
jgi:hypothetical protein